MIRLFCGYDEREAIGYHVFTHSVIAHASEPVAMHALSARGMPVGSNAFTYSRFLVPWLCNYEGHAIFCDASDMLMLADVAELDSLFDPRHAVQVVQHPNYTTRHPIKYVGTSMQCPNLSYARKNWASVMLINCEHPLWRPIDPPTLQRIAALSILQLGGWTTEDARGKPAEVGRLPAGWNCLADEGHPVDDTTRLLHWTAGIPAFPHYAKAPGAEFWHAEHRRMLEIA